MKKLGEIGKVSMCKRVFKEDTTSEGDIPFYKIGTFGKSPDAFITKERYNEFRSKFSFPKKGDILISASGTIGRRVRYDGKPAYFQDSNIVWISNDEKQVLNDYLYRFYEICNWQSTKGATISRLYNDNLKQIEIPFPKSLSEQQHIVSTLDEAFAAIAKAKANAEQNLQNAKELFESYLQGVFSMKNENWEEKCLDELGTITSSKRIYKNEYVKDGIPFYRTKEIKEISNGKNITLELFISNERYDQIKKTFGVPKINDLLISAVGTIGEIMVIENNDEFYFKDGNILWLKEFRSLDTNYLKFALMAFVEQIKNLAIGAAYNALTIEKLNKHKIAYPRSISEQQAIVQKLDALSAETKKLETIYQQKINSLEEMKKSILQKAFSGELQTQPALAL